MMFLKTGSNYNSIIMSLVTTRLKLNADVSHNDSSAEKNTLKIIIIFHFSCTDEKINVLYILDIQIAY